MNFAKQHWVFLLIFAGSCLLRFFPLFEYQFTYDELSGLDRTQFSSTAEVLEKGVKIDAHPALIQLLIYYLVRAFGYVEWIIKLPFLIFGQVAIIYAYCFGLRNFSKQSGLVAASIFAFSLIFVFYAPIARMYISGVFFSIALLYHFYEIFFNENRAGIQFIAFGLFALLCGLNQHINALFAFTLAVAGIILAEKKSRKPFLITCLCAALCYLPHLSITLYQLSIPGIGVDAGGWLEKPEATVFFTFIRALLGTGWLYFLFGALMVLSFFKGVNIVPDRKRRLLLFLFLFNFLVVYFYSLLRSPIFQFSVMLFAATALVLFISSYIDYQSKVLNGLSLGLVCAGLLYQTYVRKDYFHQSVKTVFDEQFARTLHYKNLYGEKSVFPVFFDCDTLMRKIYFNKYKSKFALKLSSDREVHYGDRAYFRLSGLNFPPDSMVSCLRLFSEMLDTLQCNYLVISSATPLYHAIAREHFPCLIENTQTQGINLKVYAKISAEQVADDLVLADFSEKSAGALIFPKKLPLKVESSDEFPYAVKTDYRNLVTHEGQVILLKLQYKLNSVPSNSLECCISAEDHTSHETKTYSGKSAGDFMMKKDSIITVYSDQFAGRNSAELRRNSDLNCFIWNRGKEAFELRSFELRVIDYWPEKWQFWE